MKVYISGMITSLKEDEYRKAFKDAVESLSNMGHDPVDPSLLGKPEHHAWHYYMKKAIAQLVECDAIYMLKGWGKSRGAALEMEIAKGLDMPIFYQINEEGSERMLNLDLGNYGQEEIL